MLDNPQLLDKQRSITASIRSVREILSLEGLSIPPYQRPYKWQHKHVHQLLNDIELQRVAPQQSPYRIGALILHRTEAGYDIVDGQQRLTTLMLIAHACGATEGLATLEYAHQDSHRNIYDNYRSIEHWFDARPDLDRKEFWRYIQERCEMVQVVTGNLSEAFQMFDTQNGRGKELEPYNLLKAYHQRVMPQEQEQLCIDYDRRWERASSVLGSGGKRYDLLKQLFAEQLYRSRLWSRGRDAWSFGKDKIEEFKGYTPAGPRGTNTSPADNLLEMQSLLFDGARQRSAQALGLAPRFGGGDPVGVHPLVQLTQRLVNGQDFFDYIETYVQIYQRLFHPESAERAMAFQRFYYRYCLNYDDGADTWGPDKFRPTGAKVLRVGDGYLREVYKSLALLVLDRFGEVVLERYQATLYRYVYLSRLRYVQLRYAHTAQKFSKIFSFIAQAKSAQELEALEGMRQARIVELGLQDGDDASARVSRRIAHFIKYGEELNNR